MPEVPDFQSVLLEKARQDLNAAEAMSGDTVFSDEIVGFHCQQAVEKAIKAVLESLGIKYPLNHDLLQLLSLIDSRASACPVSIDDATRLNPFAVRLRYDFDTDAPLPALDRSQAVHTAMLAVEWARGLVQG